MNGNMTLKALFTQMQSGDVQAHSELGTRDEMKQTRQYSSRIRKLKTVTGIYAHALVMKDVVIPFNPFTGEPDATYNSKTPFRPILLPSQVLEGLKVAVASDASLQAKWNEILGSNDIDWNAPPSMSDYFLFKKARMIQPRITSYSTVAVNFNGLRGLPEFRTKYVVDPNGLNSEGTYDWESAPVWHQAAMFFMSMVRRESEDTQTQNAVRTVRSKSPINAVTPFNTIPFLYFPINEKPSELTAGNFSGFESCMRWIAKNDDKWQLSLDKVAEDYRYDENMDFYDLTIHTPSSNDRMSSGKVYTDEDTLSIYQAMTIVPTDARDSIWSGSSQIGDKVYDNATLYASVWEAAKAYFLHSQEESTKEDGETFEKIMAASNNCRPITQIVDRIPQASYDVFLRDFASSKYFTEDIKKANSRFFILMNPDNALALAAEDEEDLEQASKDQAIALSALLSQDAAEAENFNIVETLTLDEGDLDTSSEDTLKI